MRRFPWTLLAAAVASTLALGIAVSTSAAAVKKCPKGKVTRVVNGKRTCLPAVRFRQRATPPPSPAASAVQQMLAGTVKLRLRNGRAARPPLPKAVVTAVVSKFAAAEAQLIESLRTALSTTTTARPHEIGFTGGAVSRSADGTSATANLGFGGTAGGHAISGKVEFTGKASGRMDVGFDLTVADPTGATKSSGLTARDILARTQKCPDATGKLPVTRGSDTSTRNGETFGSKRVHLGAVREATTSVSKSNANVTFGPDGRAKPFAFTVTATYDYSRSAQALAFFSARTRVVGSGTMTGTLDPATGQVSNAVVTTKGRTSGFEKGQAAADAEARTQMESMLKDEVGRLLDEVREAEKNCGGPYEVTLAARTDAVFATHNASGTLNATLTATKNPAGEFTGSAPIAYENVTFASKTDCAYHTILGTPATFSATLTTNQDGSLQVKWSAGDGSAGLSTSASVQCPGGPPPPPPIPGQPGPRFIVPAPTEFALPSTGGQRALGGGFQDGADGWTHSGTITVARKAS